MVTQKIGEFETEPLADYHMYVIDNGRTILAKETDSISIIGSQNLGGSGGFTIGIIHALKDSCSHIILNDDDALVSKESVFRMMMFLRILKEEYSDISVSGIMLDVRNPKIVYESGAQVTDGSLVPINRGLDVLNFSQIHQLFKEEHIDFSNWTFLCISSKIIEKSGLPLPLFVREDDVEYGLRMNNDTITLPGLYVWHPKYTDTFSTTNYYYYARNRMIALSCSGKVTKSFLDRIFGEMAVEASAYRYACSDEMVKGMKDFIKGPDYVFSLCKNGMHKGEEPVLSDVDELREHIRETDCIPEAGFLHRKITLNGILRKSVGDIESTPADMDSSHYYRVGKVLYIVNDKGFIAERKFTKAVGSAMRITLLRWKVRFRISRVIRKYQTSMPRYTSQSNWEFLLKDSDEKP